MGLAINRTRTHDLPFIIDGICGSENEVGAGRDQVVEVKHLAFVIEEGVSIAIGSCCD